MDDYMVITLFRHGITEANKRRAYLGWSDSPLCTDESKSIVPLNQSYDFYFTSDLGRCTDTFKLLFPDEEPKLLSELREMNFGNWEGRTFAHLKEQAEYQHWLADPIHHSPSNGESFKEFEVRVKTGWNKVIDVLFHHSYNQTAIVTHGGVIRLLLSQFAPNHKPFWEWVVPHGYGFRLFFDKESLRRGERCISLQEVPTTVNDLG